jgi:hypothetical protein
METEPIDFLLRFPTWLALKRAANFIFASRIRLYSGSPPWYVVNCFPPPQIFAYCCKQGQDILSKANMFENAYFPQHRLLSVATDRLSNRLIVENPVFLYSIQCVNRICWGGIPAPLAKSESIELILLDQSQPANRICADQSSMTWFLRVCTIQLYWITTVVCQWHFWNWMYITEFLWGRTTVQDQFKGWYNKN